MEEEHRIFDAFVSKSGTSLIITVPKAVCRIIKLKEGDVVQIKIKKEPGKRSNV